jgi:DNA-directed RNA polymerase specialized sigma subunit
MFKSNVKVPNDQYVHQKAKEIKICIKCWNLSTKTEIRRITIREIANMLGISSARASDYHQIHALVTE